MPSWTLGFVSLPVAAVRSAVEPLEIESKQTVALLLSFDPYFVSSLRALDVANDVVGREAVAGVGASAAS